MGLLDDLRDRVKFLETYNRNIDTANKSKEYVNEPVERMKTEPSAGNTRGEYLCR